MTPNSDPIRRLFRLAQGATPASPADELPFGFATRVLAQVSEREAVSPWERLSLGAVPIAAVATVLCLVFLGGLPQAPEPDEQPLAQLIVQNQLEP